MFIYLIKRFWYLLKWKSNTLVSVYKCAELLKIVLFNNLKIKTNLTLYNLDFWSRTMEYVNYFFGYRLRSKKMKFQLTDFNEESGHHWLTLMLSNTLFKINHLQKKVTFGCTRVSLEV